MIKENQGMSLFNKKSVVPICICAFASIAAVSLLPESALAAKFDINEGIKAATDPVIEALKDHWGKGVVITGIVASLIGEGDGRQRAVRAGVSAASAGGVVLALLAMFT